MAYDAFREGDFPTLYRSNKTPVTADVLEAGFIFAAAILAASLLIGLPGLHGKQILYSAIKILLGVFITAAIMITNFGQEWEVAHIDVTTQYKAGIQEEIHASVGVKIGLRSVNITLLADPEEVEFNDGKLKERINYNERFSWSNLAFTQGRAGFGPNAGRFNQEFRAGQWKGLPYPILWVAEYFTIDGEGIRWGRFYRQAGYYTHICIWLAFPLWILAMVMMHAVIRYGSYLSLLTGIFLLLANILYASIRNPNKLIIPFNHEKMLEFSWGWTFWLNLVSGLFCIAIGIVLLVMDMFASQQISNFFGVDILQDYDEIYDSPDEVLAAAGGKGRGAALEEDDSDYEDTIKSPLPAPSVLKYRKRSQRITRRIEKTLKPQKTYLADNTIELKVGGTRKPSAADSIQEEVFEDTYENNEASAGGSRPRDVNRNRLVVPGHTDNHPSANKI